MERKSVVNRECVILVSTQETDDVTTILGGETNAFFINREKAKNFIVENQDNLIKEYGIGANYTIALLDWNISFEQDDIKIVIKK